MGDVAAVTDEGLDLGEEGVVGAPEHGDVFEFLLVEAEEGGGGLDLVVVVPGQVTAACMPYLVVGRVFG